MYSQNLANIQVLSTTSLPRKLVLVSLVLGVACGAGTGPPPRQLQWVRLPRRWCHAGWASRHPHAAVLHFGSETDLDDLVHPGSLIFALSWTLMQMGVVRGHDKNFTTTKTCVLLTGSHSNAVSSGKGYRYAPRALPKSCPRRNRRWPRSPSWLHPLLAAMCNGLPLCTEGLAEAALGAIVAGLGALLGSTHCFSFFCRYTAGYRYAPRAQSSLASEPFLAPPVVIVADLVFAAMHRVTATHQTGVEAPSSAIVAGLGVILASTHCSRRLCHWSSRTSWQ